jgi:acylglycerol lipase
MRPPRNVPQLRSWTLSDGYTLHARVWPSAATPAREVIFYLHGIQSHGGWFEWSAAQLADHGRAVVLPDRRGSGLNEVDRGDSPGVSRWLDDLDELSEAALSEFAAPRCAVVGVSWGGKPAVAWALRRPERVGRLLLIAPGFFPLVDVGLAARLRVAWALLTDPRRRFPIPLDDPALFTDNPAGQEFIRRDPRKLTEATARFLYYSTQLDRLLARTRPGTLRASTTLFLAGRERIIRNEPTAAWLTRICAAPPTVRTFPAAAHTLEFEPDGPEFPRALSTWADSGA